MNWKFSDKLRSLISLFLVCWITIYADFAKLSFLPIYLWVLKWCNLIFSQRITDWQDQSTKYSASKGKTSDGCVTWCNYTITLRIQNPDPSRDYGTYQLILQSYDSHSIPYDKLALNFTVPTYQTGICTYYCCLILVVFSRYSYEDLKNKD